MTGPIIIGHGFREKLAEFKAEVDRKLMMGEVDKAIVAPPDPVTSVPCPFCGGEGKVNARVNYGHGDCTCEVFVECGSCHGRGPDTGYWGTPTMEQKLKAVDLWEKRAIKTREI
jgi:hypothetical protein